ncbi:MAG TPA: isoprenylcysteine carboxylmethyltransferase family protein [Burkholderiales bacterium]|nr:isoprenylcysteine carboxylmethyltransferase family protein [Burkholderiales bacterium]
MSFVYRYLFPALWLAWAAYWGFSSRHVKPTARSESWVSRASYIALFALAAAAFAIRGLAPAVLRERFLPLSAWPFACGAVLTAGGLLFTVWARRHLGANWSGIVTIKQDHELVTSGPYGLVRHPIYTGLLLAILGSAIALGEWRALAALAFASLALWRKLRLEERWMLRQFGERYEAYRRKVPALIPFLPS